MQRHQCSDTTLTADYMLLAFKPNVQMSPSFTRKKNLICTERDLGKRLKPEDHKVKAGVDHITMTTSSESKREGEERVDGWKKGSKAKASRRAARKEGAL